MAAIRSVGKLCSLLHVKKEYLFDLAGRANQCYHSYDKVIIRADGTQKKRHIDSPNIELKKIQKTINDVILLPAVDALPDYIHGARRGKSIATNARVHIGQEAILSLDIQDCFPSISAQRLYYVYRNFLHCSDRVASILITLTTKDAVLPQGCPSSASLCNLALAHMLADMAEDGASRNLKMSHLIDDIFYSGRYDDVRSIVTSALGKIGKSGLRPNKKKTRISRNNGPLRVAGTTVNRKMSAGKARIHKIERRILRLKAIDKHNYDITRQQRRMKARIGQPKHIEACEIERLFGEISNVTSISAAQGRRLKEKLHKKLRMLDNPSTP